MRRPVVAVDWGTSSFRLWSLAEDGTVLARASGPYGMAGLDRTRFAGVLDEQLGALDIGADVPVVICGMAGAAQGWHEAPYVDIATPLSRLGDGAVRVPGIDREVRILPGVLQTDPPNVMRGEETQLLGLLASRPGFDGVACLPGTHSKWVQMRDGRIERFTTCMTGELFALLADRSVLRHSTAGGGWDAVAFEHAVTEIEADPATLATALFGVRAGMLLNGLSSATARARLSGLLIGLELAATGSYRDGSRVALIGESELCGRYATALDRRSVPSEVLDGEALTLGGIVASIENGERA